MLGSERVMYTQTRACHRCGTVVTQEAGSYKYTPTCPCTKAVYPDFDGWCDQTAAELLAEKNKQAWALWETYQPKVRSLRYRIRYRLRRAVERVYWRIGDWLGIGS